VDFVLGDDEFSLAPFGVPGKVVCTPGHSLGSVTVLLENGDACVGDLAMNGFPFHFGPGLPIWADNLELAKRSWRMLFDLGVKTVYPGHGKSFPAEALRQSIG
jgi:glyoxylase-like metal-dependent hydrolase (beta-lactamase superfamily II)